MNRVRRSAVGRLGRTGLVLLGLFGGCRSADDVLEAVWHEQRALANSVGDGRTADRRGRVLALFEEGRIRGPRASYYAACVLITSNDVETLELARDLAYVAARGPEPERALPVAARAVDRILIRQRRPQRYGTQVAFDGELGRWKLASFDPQTTDEDRRAMYLPTLAEQRERAERMNER